MPALCVLSGRPSVPRIRCRSRSRTIQLAAEARCAWSDRTDRSSASGPVRPRATLPRILRCFHAERPGRADSYTGGSAAPDRKYGGQCARHAVDPAAPGYAARRGSPSVRLTGQRRLAERPPGRAGCPSAASQDASSGPEPRAFDARTAHTQATNGQRRNSGGSYGDRPID
jgi:hypothetical protein